MKTTVTKELMSLLKDKRFRAMVLNFTDEVVRLTFEERSRFTKVETRPFYHIKAEPSRYTRQTGMSRVENYYMSPILAVIKPGDVLCFSIEKNGTDQLKKAGFEWQYLKLQCFRKDKFICQWYLDNAITDFNNPWLPLNNVVEWGETRFDEFITY